MDDLINDILRYGLPKITAIQIFDMGIQLYSDIPLSILCLTYIDGYLFG